MPFLLMFLAYIVLVVIVGVQLVEYMAVAFIGHTINVLAAAIIAALTGFNFLIPAALVTFVLQILHIIH